MAFSIQESPLRALDEAAALELIAQQERWWVERKQEPHVEALAEEIASFANSDGGWILLNIADRANRPIEAEPTGAMRKFADSPQDWLAQKLRGQLDPLPAFEAKTISVDGALLGVVRVPRSPLAPVLATATGVLFERGAGGKERIGRIDRVRELVARREDERRHAEARLGAPSTLPEIDRRLGVPSSIPPRSTGRLSVLVRATPVAFDPRAFEPVALGKDAAADAAALLPDLLTAFGQRAYGNVRHHLRHADVHAAPMQRGFVMTTQLDLNLGYGDRLRIGATVVADAGGVVGVKLFREQTLKQQLHKGFSASALRDEWLLPVLDFLASQILAAYVSGPLLFDLWIRGLSDWELTWDLAPVAQTQRQFGQDAARSWIQAGAEAECTLDELRRARVEGSLHPFIEVAGRWSRDVAREAGIAVYEPW